MHSGWVACVGIGVVKPVLSTICYFRISFLDGFFFCIAMHFCFLFVLLFILYRYWCFSKTKSHALSILCSLYSYAAGLCGYSCCPELCPFVLFYIDNIEVIGIHIIPLI